MFSKTTQLVYCLRFYCRYSRRKTLMLANAFLECSCREAELALAAKYPNTPLISCLENDPVWQTTMLDLFDQHNRAGVTLVSIFDDSYPFLLQQIDDPPVLLFCKGNPSVFGQPCIAIVGSRSASVAGLSIAHELAAQLVGAGLCVVSGLALGIDGAAHRGALEASGTSLAVLGCGPDVIYPKRHKELAAQLSISGCLVSEYSLGCKPLAKNFPPRNRIISGLCHGVIVVEARPRSGTLITARLALEQNREVFAVPGSIRYEGSKGVHSLIQQGAKLVQCVDDILDELPFFHSQTAFNEEVCNVSLDADQQRLFALIDSSGIGVDELITRLSIDAALVITGLSELELAGVIVRDGSRYYKK
ncbi:MAG: DNA-processing protein DprA [Pseudomonadales bacterium]